MAPRADFGSALRKLGWVATPPNRSMIISVPDLEDCANLEWLVARLRERNTRLTIFFLSPSSSARSWLASHFGPEAILDAPWNLRASCLLFLLTSRARLLLAVGDITSAPEKLVSESYLLGIASAVVEARLAQPGASSFSRTTEKVDWWQPRSAVDRRRLLAAGLRPERISETDADAGPPANAYGETLDCLHALMARRPPNRRRLQRLVMVGFDRPFWRRLLALRARRIESLSELNIVLGNPQAILCLGNGPSSEDPRLDGIEYDCLFRVNHRWLKRGSFCNPDLVFTGQKRTLFTVRRAIFAFQTRRAEAHLVTHQVFNPLCPRMRYVTLERIGILDGHDWDGVRPTNGATMLAAAVALAPKRLVVAGIDLFEDPAGPYPGDAATPNDYVLVHERDLEIQFILTTLRSYHGELVILSKALTEKWIVSGSAATL